MSLIAIEIALNRLGHSDLDDVARNYGGTGTRGEFRKRMLRIADASGMVATSACSLRKGIPRK